MKKTALMLLLALSLTACGQTETKDVQFESTVNTFCDNVVAIDASINAITNLTGDTEGLAAAKEELLYQLAGLNDEFRRFANMDFPEEFDYLESMADEAGDYMTEAVNTYKKMYGEEDAYSVTLEEYANENYARAYKRVRIITALLRGETPNEEGLTIQ